MDSEMLSILSNELMGVVMDVENSGKFDQVCFDTILYVAQCLNDPNLIQKSQSIILGDDVATVGSHAERRMESLGMTFEYLNKDIH